MTILLTAHAAERHGDLIRDAAPDEPWLLMDDDGTIRNEADGAEVPWEEASPTVAWLNSEIYDRPIARKYFGFLMRTSDLEWIQSSAAGTDHPIFSALAERGAVLTNAHVGDVNISEYVLGQVLADCQGHDVWRQAQRDREWRPHEIREIERLRWLVVGVGAIGSAVSRRARAFGCHVTGVRRSPDGAEPVDEMILPDDVVAAAAHADVVVLTAPSTPETRHVVDAEFLASMTERSILVNIARGALIDEAALLAALDSGIPEVAILDVTETEPLPADSPLWTHPRVVLTPHSSGRGDGHYRRAAEVFADNLRRHVRGEQLRNRVTV